VTFAPILKHRIFPLPDIMDLILEMGTLGMGAPVEIEFAVNLGTPPGQPKEFAFLQIRPLVLSREVEEMHIQAVRDEDLICRSSHVLGNGAFGDIRDVVMVDIHRFDRGKSREAAEEVSALNSKLIAAQRPYVLIGVGRWGSTDPWLGIPVTWDQISGASTIVEAGFKDFVVTPSQGTHFFQNITSFQIGYFTVNTLGDQGFLDWQWLSEQPPVEDLNFVRHLAFEKPITVRINGQKSLGVILKPGKG